jgi:hypothetical protein
MLLHQFIIVVAATAKRFDSVLLSAVSLARRVVARTKIGGSELPET